MNTSELRDRASTSPERWHSPRLVISLIVSLVALVALTLAYSVFVSTRATRQYYPLVQRTTDLQLALTEAHLWLEEVIAGDTSIGPEQVRRLHRAAAGHAHAISAGGTRILAAAADEMRDLLDGLDTIGRRTEQRVEAVGAGIGSPADQEFDSLFAGLLATADKLRSEVLTAVAHEMRLLRRLQAVLVFLCVLLGGLTAGMSLRFGRQRGRDLAALLAANQQLDAANQQLSANEQQLRAANQQLGSEEQQLKAINQQLSAHEQQLRAANQQLRAQGEQLRESEGRYRSLFENLITGMAYHKMVFDGAGKPVDYVFLELNRKFEELTGLSSGKAVGQRVTEVLPGIETAEFDWIGRYGRVAQGGPPELFEQYSPELGKWFSVSAYSPEPGYFVALFEDMTAAKKDAIELGRERERAMQYLDTAAIMMVALDCNGKVTLVNRKGCEILGGTQEDIVGRDWFDTFVPPGVGDTVRGVFNKIVAGEMEGTEYYDNPVRTLDGRAFLLGVFHDVTEARRAEEITAASERRFRSLVRNASDLTMIWRADGIVVYASPSSERVLGCEPSGLEGRDFDSCVTAESRAAVRDGLSEILRRPGEPILVEFTVTGLGGKDIVLEALACNLLNDPDVGGIVVNARDVTARKTAEEALVREHDLLTRITEASPAGVVQLDAQGAIVFANQRAEQLLGISRDSMTGRTYNAPEWRIRDVAGGPLADEELPFSRVRDTLAPVTDMRHAIEWPDGRRVLLSVSGAPLMTATRKFEGGVMVMEDVTARTRMEEELQKSQKIESLGLLAGGIAHDFNNLLGGVFGYLDMAREEWRTGGQRIGEYLEKSLKGFHRAKDLTQQLLTFSKGGAPVKRVSHIDGVVREAATLSLSGSNVHCTVDSPDDLWCAEIDQGQISQVINNMVINARHAMPKGGRIVIGCANLDVGADSGLPLHAGPHVVVSVGDQGIGIPPDHLSRVFDPFFTTKQQGSGLGLATSFSIVQKHGGHITVKSELGSGTVFSIYLPALPGREPEGGNSPAVSRIPASACRLLVMDDEEVILDMARDMLASRGYTVATAHSGEEAIKLYADSLAGNERFDVVVLDLTVAGGMGGQEAVQELLKIDPDVRAVVSSGYSDDPVMGDPERFGFCAVARKPYRLKELMAAIAEARGMV